MSESREAAEASRRGSKRASAFRTIGEVAEELELPAHVLRFWEAKFPQLKPLKRGGGRRYYRPEDILLLRRIRECLYQDGYTIRGVQRLLRDGPAEPEPPKACDADEGSAPTLFALEPPRPEAEVPRPLKQPSANHGLPPNVRDALEEIRQELLEIRGFLDELRLGKQS